MTYFTYRQIYITTVRGILRIIKKVPTLTPTAATKRKVPVYIDFSVICFYLNPICTKFQLLKRGFSQLRNTGTTRDMCIFCKSWPRLINRFHDLLRRGSTYFKIRSHELLCRGHELVSRSHDLISHGHE